LALRRLAELSGRSGWMSTPAGAIRYTVRGPPGAQDLLVLHGLGDSIAGWARAALPLSKRYRVHLLDLPGHGLSADPPDYKLSTFVDAVERYAQTLRKPLILGHSLGGWIAQRLLLRNPELASGLLLVNPAGAMVSAEELGEFLQLLQPKSARDAWRYLDRAFHRAPLALRLLPNEIIKAMSAPSAQGFFASLGDGDFLVGDELARLRLPIRLLWGKHDRFLPAGTLPFFQRFLKEAKFQIIERAGHCPHLEVPADLARTVLG
jgi:pimeloyl-ACP methyl ester carboxylesterase